MDVDVNVRIQNNVKHIRIWNADCKRNKFSIS